MKITTRVLIVSAFMLFLSQVSGAQMNKLKEQLGKAGSTQGSKPAQSNAAQGNQPPSSQTTETLMIDFKNAYLQYFPIAAYKGEPIMGGSYLPNFTSGVSMRLVPTWPDLNKNLYFRLKSIAALDSTSTSHRGIVADFMTKEAKATLFATSGATEFDQMRAKKAYAASGVTKAVVKASMQAKPIEEGYILDVTSLGSYDFEKGSFPIILDNLGDRKLSSYLGIDYKVAPEAAEKMRNEIKYLYVVRHQSRNDAIEIYKDPNLKDLFLKVERSTLEFTSGKYKAKYVPANLSNASYGLFKNTFQLNYKKTAFPDSRYICMEGIYLEYVKRRHLMDMKNFEMYRPNAILQKHGDKLREACKSSQDVFMVAEYGMVLNKSELDSYGVTSFKGPFKACDLLQKIERGEGTELFYLGFGDELQLITTFTAIIRNIASVQSPEFADINQRGGDCLK